MGDRVAVYGGPYVHHAEYLLVPKTLCVLVPNDVSLKDASLGGIGAIAIHALRKANLQFGEVAIVVGLGIYGHLIGQLGLNAGYQIIPLNRSKPRADLFEKVIGLRAYTDEKELERTINTVTNGHGADAVFLCAGGDDGHLTNKSLEWLRDKGKSIIVGDIRPNYERRLMFKKEIDILISRAGGPGRYDINFEQNAVDYPYGQVRWTETRNVAEFIRLLSTGRIKVEEYISQVCSFDDVEAVYARLLEHGSNGLTEVFEYND